MGSVFHEDSLVKHISPQYLVLRTHNAGKKIKFFARFRVKYAEKLAVSAKMLV